MTNNIQGLTPRLILASTLLVSGALQPASADSAEGYLVDSQGNIVRSGANECLHSGNWKSDMATVVGCDGVVLEVPVEVVEGQPSGLLFNISIPAAELFAFDSADFSEQGKQAMQSYRETLRPEMTDAYAAVIVGHTDSTGDANYNMGLSQRRAAAVRDWLVGTGADASKLRVVGRGEEEPIASNDTAEGRALNRRVDVIVVGELRALDAMRFPSVALFERRSGELTAAGKQVLDKHRQEARDLLSRATYIEVIGHTDSVGDDAYNQALSEQRATSVRNYLIEAGVDAGRIQAFGMGESMPIASNRTDEGRAQNRRVEVLVLGRLK